MRVRATVFKSVRDGTTLESYKAVEANRNSYAVDHCYNYCWEGHSILGVSLNSFMDRTASILEPWCMAW